MKESSLIIFKPNLFFTNEIYSFVVRALNDSNLAIEKEYLLQISEQHFCKMWPWLQKDIILFYTHKEFYKKKVKVIEIRGENAIAIVDKIKNYVRVKFANSLFMNCIHAPRDEMEYLNDITSIREDSIGYCLNFPVLRYSSYKLLDTKTCDRLAKIILGVNLYTMMPYISQYCNCDSKYKCYLVNGCAQMFTHYVCFICDYLSYYNLDEAVILACILVANKEICVYSGNDETFSHTLISEAIKYRIEINLYKIK